jgi:hypothetical protein
MSESHKRSLKPYRALPPSTRSTRFPRRNCSIRASASRGQDARCCLGPLRCGAGWRNSPQGDRQDVGHRFVGTRMCRRNSPTPRADLEDRMSGRRNAGVSFLLMIFSLDKQRKGTRPLCGRNALDLIPRKTRSGMRCVRARCPNLMPKQVQIMRAMYIENPSKHAK